MNAITETPAIITPPLPGTFWPEQGGIYVGSYIKDGALHHGISAAGTENDIITSFNHMSEKIQGLAINGFTDWRAPDQREGMLTYVHAADDFHRTGYESVYLTSTPYDSSRAWVVDFEDGHVGTLSRRAEWRVRPFRSIIA